jgi:ADP-glucose pyrophosphorylase
VLSIQFMTFESNDVSRDPVASTLGVLVVEGHVPHEIAGAAVSATPSVKRLAGSLKGASGAGVLQIGLGGGHALHAEGRDAAAAPSLARQLMQPCAGTAEALYRSLPLVEQLKPARVLVQIGDHADDVDYRALLATHGEGNLGATVGCVEVPAEVAQSFAVLGTDARGRVVRCAHRPRQPQRLPDDAARSLIAADVFVFDLEPLVDCLAVDAVDPASTRDLCRDVLPLLVRAGELGAHVFQRSALVSRYVPR